MPSAWEAAGAAGQLIRGERAGEGPAVVQLHGLTATRRYVVHGSKLMQRSGLTSISYDARGHGTSDPAPAGSGYSYSELTADLGAVLGALELETDRPALLAGHSMGAHTAAAFALAEPDRVGALVLICPASTGTPLDDRKLAGWDRLAAGAERGVEGFLAAYDDGTLDPDWHDTLIRIARDRLSAHADLSAVAAALREVPRSLPFDGLAALAAIDVPALVVASRDEADPGHPYAIAREWAAELPRSRLISEEPGESPLAWQGGRLSREIASFRAEPAVAERIG